jgi:hypothetical protein
MQVLSKVMHAGKDMKDAMEAEQEEAEENAAAGPRPVDAKGKPIFTPEEIQKKQQKQKALADKKTETRKARVEKLSENLVNKVSIFAEGAKSENDRAVVTSFKEICRLEAAELVKESYGWELLQAIGRTYISKSECVSSIGAFLFASSLMRNLLVDNSKLRLNSLLWVGSTVQSRIST